MLRVLVFGSAGFIGGHLVRHLREAGARVFPAARTSRAPDQLSCDVTEPGSVRKAFEAANPDVVFQLAGTCAVSDPRTHYLVHTAGAVNILEAASLVTPRAALVFAGSAAEYGEAAPEDLPLRETQPERPVTFYGAAKLAQTTAVAVGALSLGLKTSVFRPFNIIGPGLPGHYFLGALAGQLAERSRAGLSGPFPVYNAGSTRDYLDVRDAVQALRLLSRHVFDHGPGAAVYNLCSGQEVPILEPARRLGARFGGFEPVDAGAGDGRSGILRSVGDPAKLQGVIPWRPTINWEQSVDDFHAALLRT